MFETRVTLGAAALDQLDRLESLWDELQVPHCARSPWLSCYARAFPHVTAVVVTVEVHERPAAVACLARTGGPVVQWTALGHEVSDYAPMAARDGAAAHVLADAIADNVLAGAQPWRLRLQQVPVDDPTAARLRTRLACSQMVTGTAAARLALTAPRTVDNHVSRNARKTLNKACNRLRRDGREVDLDRCRDAARIVATTDRMITLHRARDHELGRRSDLDDRSGRTFYRNVIAALAARGQLEMITLTIDGELAAYALGILDGSSYRVWDGRYATAWTAYSPGRICDFAALESALGDERFDTVDWMRGVLAYKSQAMTHVAEFEHLHAWSAPTLRTGYAAALAGRQAVRAAMPTSLRHWVRTRAR